MSTTLDTNYDIQGQRRSKGLGANSKGAPRSSVYKDTRGDGYAIDFMGQPKNSQYSIAPSVGNTKNSGNFLDGLGSIYGSVKDTVWGKSVPQMSKDAGGFYNTDFWDASQWQKFGEAKGYVDGGKLYNADGSAFDVSSIGGDVSKLGSTTEGGLGGLLSSDSLKTAGEVAGNLGQVFGMYQAANDIFGSGAKSRKAAERRLEEGFQQNYAMNQMAMDKFREDNAHFKKQRADITASYNA